MKISVVSVVNAIAFITHLLEIDNTSGYTVAV
jgi:hypothetical protein